ncbi:MAG TPA: enoyl-CoA hydratase-related protein [Actinomycetota bacterium]|nr:enoyl-CoA hydratase-related protein [Actinomycetota bacterium]
MADAPVLVERSGGIVTLTLNKPDVRNAMTADLTDAFTAAIDDLREDQDARVLIITGAGKAFCAGGDLSFIQPGPGASVPAIRAKMRAFYGKFLAVRDLEIPTIAAINGSAVGAGLCLALACDLRLAAADAKLTAAFTKLGLHPGMAGTYLLTRLVGSARAADLLFTSRVVSGAEAESMGLVNRAVPRESLAAETRALAEEIAANAPVATRLVKRAIQLAERNDLDTMLEYEALAQPVTMATADLLEGLAAVKEKRAPSFDGT